MAGAARVMGGPEAIAQGVRTLRAGGVVAFPTETVYGLGANALDADAVARVFALKDRPSDNPLIVHVADTAMAQRVVADWPEDARRLAERFWPGPLTLVLPKAPGVPDSVTAGGTTVGVRAPAHPLTLALIEAFGGPLVGPSANRSGRVSPTTPEHVADAFAGEDLLVLDGGACTRGIESTVLDLTADPPRVLRPGVITPGEIAAVLGRPVETDAGADSAGAPERAPGRLGPHYRPRSDTWLVPPSETLAPALFARPKVVLSTGGRARGWNIEHVFGIIVHEIQMPRTAREYAARLYAALHEADQHGCVIVIEEPPDADDSEYLTTDQPSRALWAAIHERLLRAATPIEP
ncbi:MAG: threonylcarbamoyl-AMP synthase [Phycisphaeraceae bacterium]|nr:MAG: threonylcarbamoyl-AMP synthase [Phycisphaeraceae bacterium]